MKYSFTSRIRYSETDHNMRLTFPAMMDYFQDTSTFHGEDNNLPLTLLYKEKIAWVLTGWQVRLFENAGLNDIATFTTWSYGFRGNIAMRNFTLTNESGVLCAVADAQYVLMNLEKQLPTRITQQLVDGYTVEPDSHINLGLTRKIKPLEDELSLEPFTVREYMLDTNNHVNNSQYIKLALSLLRSDKSFNCFRAEYKKQARLGDVFYPNLVERDDFCQIKFYDDKKELFFIAEWTFDPEQKREDYDSAK